MFLSFSKQFRNTRSGVTSSVFYDEALLPPRRLTIDHVYLSLNVGRTGIVPTTHTLFNEIKLIAPKWKFRLQQRNTQPADVVAAVERVIQEHWSLEKFHVVFHSSGYDSRLISGILRTLRETLDLGQLLFVCTKWEREVFLQVMEYEGWKPGQYMVIRPRCPDVRYYNDALDFRNVFRQNGVSFAPLNFFYWVVDELQRSGVLPADEELQIWSGAFANEGEGVAKHGGLHRQLKRWYYSAEMGSFVFKGQPIFPFTHTSVLEAKMGLPAVELREHVYPVEYLKVVDPALALFKNRDFPGDKGFPVSPRTRRSLCSAYQSSWYARNVGPSDCRHATRRVGFSRWWRDVTAASLIEHLREEGRRICL